jgi:hypothetical protein
MPPSPFYSTCTVAPQHSPSPSAAREKNPMRPPHRCPPPHLDPGATATPPQADARSIASSQGCRPRTTLGCRHTTRRPTSTRAVINVPTCRLSERRPLHQCFCRRRPPYPSRRRQTQPSGAAVGRYRPPSDGPAANAPSAVALPHTRDIVNALHLTCTVVDASTQTTIFVSAESHHGTYVISSTFPFIQDLFCPLADQCGREK